MKKFIDTIRPFLSIIFGALLLLYFLNYLSSPLGEEVAIGIISTIVAAYYLAVGIVSILAGNALNKNAKEVLDIVAIGIFPVFLFVYHLIKIIELSDLMGPNGWVVEIVALVSSLLLAFAYVLAKFAKNEIFNRLACLFAGIFALSLVLTIAFDDAGDANVLGAIDVVKLIIFACYLYMLFGSLAIIQNKKEDKVEEELKEESEK